MMRWPLILFCALAASACKPPPTDADIASRDAALPTGPSEPIDSPDTEGALWSDSPVTPGRIIYGIPGNAPLIALDCTQSGGQPMIRLTRYALADEGAGALAALIGNGHVARIPVDATEADGASIWVAEIAAGSADWEVLTGTREVAVTIPGAGRLVLNPSPRPAQFIEQCRETASTGTISADAQPAL